MCLYFKKKIEKRKWNETDDSREEIVNEITHAVFNKVIQCDTDVLLQCWKNIIGLEEPF